MQDQNKSEFATLLSHGLENVQLQKRLNPRTDLPPFIGTIVGVRNLKKNSFLNGKGGICTGWDEKRQRFIVHLRGDPFEKPKLIKPPNLDFACETASLDPTELNFHKFIFSNERLNYKKGKKLILKIKEKGSLSFYAVKFIILWHKYLIESAGKT